MAEDTTPTNADGPTKGRRRLVRALIGWLLVPALVLGALFAAGVHIGARHPDMALTRAVLWLTQAEAERPPPAEASASASSEADEGLPPPPSGPPELFELEFRWPIPAQAIVEEWIEEPGKTAKLRYRIEVEREGEQLLVHHRDPRVLELDGRPVELTGSQAELEGYLLQAGFIPSIAARLDGEFVGVLDMDAYIARTREVLASNPEQLEQFARVAGSPERVAMLEESVGDVWRTWVETWVGFEIRSDHELRFESHEGLGVYRVVGLDADRISLEFRYEREFTRDELQTLFVVNGSVPEDDPAKLDAELEGVTGGRSAVETATLRRDTLRPLRVSQEADMWIQVPGEARKTRRELHRYTFEWQ